MSTDALSKAEGANRDHLVELAQKTADTLTKPPYRAVVIVTDEAGDFVGVGMNTTLDDAINIMKCALYAPGLIFHDVEHEGKHSRRSRAARPQCPKCKAGYSAPKHQMCIAARKAAQKTRGANG